MSATATRMTAEEYYAVTVEGDRRQLVEGEIVVNEPKAIHAVLELARGEALTSPQLPGFALALDGLFAR